MLLDEYFIHTQGWDLLEHSNLKHVDNEEPKVETEEINKQLYKDNNN